ncbi:MAG: sodium-dependent transporter [Candidatus Aminicenantes bacterium]|nr:MAG: sodium-dependent transporter [Candidatus Aminicenantes bacterium]
MKKHETFSRWGIIFAGLGMAVGTGNLWRFPRIASQYGGGAFLIAWMFFLFVWAIPLLTIELSIGKKTRLGVIGSFGKMIGKNFAWMGTFVAFVTAAITFYYTVVTGWCIKYFFSTCFQGLIKKEPMQYWENFTSSWGPVVFHFIAIVIGCSIIYFGVAKGIERANKILIPSLFVLLLIAVGRSLSLPGAAQGMNFLFSPNLSQLKNIEVWLNALSQAAWSTGAGWGLMLTYGVYSRKKENPFLTSASLGFGNNIASLLAGIAVIPTVFAFFAGQNMAQEKVLDIMKQGNEGLTFKWIPTLFSQIPSGSFFLALFFLALCFAAFSSLISQLELITRIFMDSGLTRKKSVSIVGISCFALGFPSAISIGFFNNQDWVWGLGLMVSGSFFIFLVLKVGPRKFRKEIITSSEHSVKLGKAFDYLVAIFLPLQLVAMLVWWFWDSYKTNPDNWLDIFAKASVGTVLFQWGIAIAVFIIFNKIITKKLALNNDKIEGSHDY